MDRLHLMDQHALPHQRKVYTQMENYFEHTSCSDLEQEGKEKICALQAFVKGSSQFTYSDIADRTDFRLKWTKHGERAVLRSSPQSQSGGSG